MEDRSSRRMRTLVTQMAPVRGLSANENARALISMMARSTKPLQSEAGYIDARPQSRQIDEISCDARPDHTLGQTRSRRHRLARQQHLNDRTRWRAAVASGAGQERTTVSVSLPATDKSRRARRLRTIKAHR